MTTNPFDYSRNQSAKNFAKKFWHKFGKTTEILWQSVVQHTDGILPIRVRKHWVVLLVVLLPTIATSIVALWLSSLIADRSWRGLQWLLWCIALAAVLYLAWTVLEWLREILTVAHDTFEVEKGVITTKDNIVLIDPVTKVEFQRPLLGWILGYVTLKIVSPGQAHAVETFEYLPKHFKPIIEKLIRSRAAD